MAALTPAGSYGPQDQKRSSTQKPFLGKDILQRMTQLEQKKKLSSNATKGLFGSRKSAYEQTQPASPRQSLPPTPKIVRSTTAPDLMSRPVEKQMPKVSTTTSPLDQSSPSLLTSSTWDRDSERKKMIKQEKERKEQDKRQKKEEERLRKEEEKAAGKSGRRLSKKPPPAMITQRNASALALYDEPKRSPNSLRDRRPSSSGSLASAMRGFLTRRASSSQSPEPEQSRPTSRLDSCTTKASRPHSRSSLLDKFSSDDDAYVTDLVDFAYQMEESTQKALEAPTPEKPKTKRPSIMPVISPALNTPPSSSGQDQAAQKSDTLKQTSSSSIETMSFYGKRDNAAGGYMYPDFNKLLKKDKARTMTSLQPPAEARVYKTLQDFRSNSSPNVRARALDGGNDQLGYVQRQRMNQQQGSIDGFEEQMAVKTAVELATVSESQFPPTPEDSTESLGNRDKAVQEKTVKAHQEVPDKTAGQTSRKEETQQRFPERKSESRDRQNPKTQQDKQKTGVEAVYPRDDKTKAHVPTLPLQSQSANINAKKVEKPEDVQPVAHSKDTASPKLSPLKALNNARSRGNSTSKQQQIETQSRKSHDLVLSPKALKGQDIPTPKEFKSSVNEKWFELPPLPKSSTSPIFGEFGPRVTELDQPASTEKPAKTTAEQASLTPEGKSDKASKHASMPLPALKPSMTKATVSTAESASEKKSEIEIPVTNSEGLIRKTSIKRPRSDPELKVPELKSDAPKSDLPSLDFLPQLKHQPLPRPKRTSRVSFGPLPESPSLNKSALTASATDLSKPSDLALSPTKLSPPSSFPTPRSTKRTSFGATNSLSGASGKPIAKMFVICCKCRFWHDLPSRLYEAMALPQTVRKTEDLNRPGSGGSGSGSEKSKKSRRGSNSETSRPPGISGPIGSGGVGASYVGPPAPSSSAGLGMNGGLAGGNGEANTEFKPLEGKIFTDVKCPWCEHGMSTSCCAGWTAIIYLHERHH